jgi:S-formylglutathione hydrolase FrmB
MQKLTIAMLASCLTVFAAGCIDGSNHQVTPGSITEKMIAAPALEGNLLGDPTEQRVSVYLPPGYDSKPDKRYPVLYLLHGFTGTNRTWMIDPENPDLGQAADPRDGGYQHAGFLERERLDAIIAAGTVPDLIVVAPNGRNTFKHSFYVNSPVTGNWEDYVVEDVVSHIDANYRTIPTAASRGIAGHSGGANGALFLAMRHSDVFGSVYAMAPCCSGYSFSLPPFEDRNTGRPTQFWKDVYTRIHALSATDQLPDTFTDRREDFYVNAELAASAAYFPNPDRAPFYSDFLFEMHEGNLALNEKALEQRLARSVYHLVDQHEADLRSLRGILIDYGEHEMEDLVVGNSQFAKVLARRGIPFEFEVYAGGNHGNMVATRLESRGLRFFADTLKFSAD